MTAKEKAFIITKKIADSLFENDCRINQQGIKATSLICVEEILAAIPKLIGGRALFDNPDIVFWNEVKTKIEKL